MHLRIIFVRRFQVTALIRTLMCRINALRGLNVVLSFMRLFSRQVEFKVCT